MQDHTPHSRTRRDGADGIIEAFIEATCTHVPKCCFRDAAWGLQEIAPRISRYGGAGRHAGQWSRSTVERAADKGEGS
jgi:hypothetical protein